MKPSHLLIAAVLIVLAVVGWQLRGDASVDRSAPESFAPLEPARAEVDDVAVVESAEALPLLPERPRPHPPILDARGEATHPLVVRITDVSGEPVPGAVVEVLGEEPRSSWLRGHVPEPVLARGVAADLGDEAMLVLRVPESGERLRVDAPGWRLEGFRAGFTVIQPPGVLVGDGERTMVIPAGDELELVLRAGLDVELLVEDAGSGQPVTGADIELEFDGSQVAWPFHELPPISAVTDGEGRFTRELPVTGWLSVTIRVRCEGFEDYGPVAFGLDPEARRFARLVRLVPSDEIAFGSGVVTDAGVPVVGAPVRVSTVHEYESSGQRYVIERWSGSTDAQGEFRFQVGRGESEREHVVHVADRKRPAWSGPMAWADLGLERHHLRLAPEPTAVPLRILGAPTGAQIRYRVRSKLGGQVWSGSTTKVLLSPEGGLQTAVDIPRVRMVSVSASAPNSETVTTEVDGLAPPPEIVIELDVPVAYTLSGRLVGDVPDDFVLSVTVDGRTRFVSRYDEQGGPARTFSVPALPTGEYVLRLLSRDPDTMRTESFTEWTLFVDGDRDDLVLDTAGFVR